MTDQRVYVVGIGDDGAAGLTGTALDVVAAADVLVGGERQLGFFPEFSGEKWIVQDGLKAVVERIRGAGERRVVVLASGDPLFYGIGAYLARQLGAETLSVIPHVSSVQLAFARCGESWQDAAVVSVHGRSLRGLAQRVNACDKVALLTDDVNTPAAIANYLLSFGMVEYRAFVGENLGGPGERTGWYSLTELADGSFAPLNVVILKRNPADGPPRFGFGIDDEAFVQRKPDRGLITKREVRVLCLSELRLEPGAVLWDIGACTGSVSIEAVLQTPELRVYAIEKNAEDLENLRANQVRFRTDFVAVHGKAPAGLEEFEDPDAVFIGGSGGELAQLLAVCAARLRPQGRIVMTAITLETLAEAQQTLRQLGFDVSVTLIQTARSKPILHMTRLEGMNPVFLLTASRQAAGGGTADG